MDDPGSKDMNFPKASKQGSIWGESCRMRDFFLIGFGEVMVMFQKSFFFFFYVFLAVLGLHCYLGFSSKFWRAGTTF